MRFVYEGVPTHGYLKRFNCTAVGVMLVPNGSGELVIMDGTTLLASYSPGAWQTIQLIQELPEVDGVGAVAREEGDHKAA